MTMYRGPLLARDLREARERVRGKRPLTAVRMLLRRDFSYAQIAEVLRVSTSRVARIVRPQPRGPSTTVRCTGCGWEGRRERDSAEAPCRLCGAPCERTNRPPGRPPKAPAEARNPGE